MAKKNIYIENQYHYGETIGYISKCSELREYLTALGDNASDLDSQLQKVKKDVSSNAKVNDKQEDEINKNNVLDKKQGKAIVSNTNAIKALALAITENAEAIAENVVNIEELNDKTNGLTQAINRINNGIANYVKPSIDDINSRMDELDSSLSGVTPAIEEITNHLTDIDTSLDSISISGDNNVYTLFVDGEERGTITLPKDQFVKSIQYDENTKEIVFIYNIDAQQGELRISLVDLVDIYKAGNGLQLTDKVFSILINPQSEAYLTVNENGLLLSGITELSDSIDEIIEDMKDIVDSINDNAENINKLFDETTNISASTLVNTANINALNNATSAITLDLFDVNNKVTLLQTEDKNLKSYIDAVSANTLSIPLIQEDIVTINDEISELTQISNTNEENINKLESGLTQVNDSIDIINAQISGINEDLQKEVLRSTNFDNECQNLLIDLATSLSSETESRISGDTIIENEIQQISQEIELKASIEDFNELSGQVITKAEKSELEALESEIEGISQSIEIVDGKVETLSLNLSDFKTEVADTYATKDEIPNIDNCIKVVNGIIDEDGVNALTNSGYYTKADLESEIEAHIEQYIQDNFVTKTQYEDTVRNLQAQIDALKNLLA